MAASVRRRHSDTSPAKAAKAPVRLATSTDQARAAPVHDQHLMLQAAFAEPEERPYPGYVKLAVFIGAPVALWAGIILAGAQLLRIAAQ